MTKKGLGKGLSALFQDSPSEQYSDATVQEIDISLLSAGAFQPRLVFDQNLLQELSESIKENGVLQPIVIRSVGNNGTFEIIAGERRWRAAKAAGLTRIPAVIRNVEDKVALEIGLIENIQRKSLTPIEEAEGYQKLLKEFSYTQEQLAKKIGKSRSHISNLLRLLELPDDIKQLVNDEKLSMGHARTLIGQAKPQTIAQTIIEKGLSVREAEALTHDSTRKSIIAPKKATNTLEKDPDLMTLEAVLSDNLGLPVVINDKRGRGEVAIHFNDLKDLDRIIQRLSAA